MYCFSEDLRIKDRSYKFAPLHTIFVKFSDFQKHPIFRFFGIFSDFLENFQIFGNF